MQDNIKHIRSIDLSIVIPAFNEEKSLPKLLEKLITLDFGDEVEYEIIVVDDASTDKSQESVQSFLENGIKFHRLPVNSGKGAAVRKGVSLSLGRYIIVQDADLEYFPNDIPKLLRAAIAAPGATVYGSRVLGAQSLSGFYGVARLWPKQSLPSWLFNILLTFWLFMIKKVWITDTLTGYKLYPREIFQEWSPTTNGFETDHEITSKILNDKRKIIEVPIDYSPRSKLEGKKIRAIDGYIALRTFWTFRK